MSQDNGHERSAAAVRFAERAGGERGESGRGARGASGPLPDPELVERPKRRRFTAKYKLEILERAEACTRPGGIGELLRREGVYTAPLTAWRRQRKAGAVRGPGEIAELWGREGLYTSHLRACGRQRKAGGLRELGRSRGRKPAARRDREIAELRRRAEAELERAKKVIEIQGNVSALLEQMLGTEGAEESTER